MRDYLKLEEIQRILEGQLTKEEVRHIMDVMEIEADTCLCHATGPNECLCGAWDE